MATKNRTAIFEINGVVLEGKKKGKELGFPTANISCDNSTPAGIYAGEAIWKGTAYQAAIYKSDEKDTIEAHLLDFSDNLYGETITIVAEQKIRDSRFFSDRKELITAISKDIEDIRKLISADNYRKI
ncbi:MAG: riboflavin kinase [Candidatus Liptonbacteria bacterium]|nr:riboflavin kinase [Candidatus Liptonbacteria bacterium]